MYPRTCPSRQCRGTVCMYCTSCKLSLLAPCAPLLLCTTHVPCQVSPAALPSLMLCPKPSRSEGMICTAWDRSRDDSSPADTGSNSGQFGPAQHSTAQRSAARSYAKVTDCAWHMWTGCSCRAWGLGRAQAHKTTATSMCLHHLSAAGYVLSGEGRNWLRKPGTASTAHTLTAYPVACQDVEHVCWVQPCKPLPQPP